MSEAMPKILWTVIWVIVGLVLVFYIVGGLSSTLTTSATQISNSGLPLANLFSSSGVLFIIFMIVLFIGLIILVAKMAGHGKH